MGNRVLKKNEFKKYCRTHNERQIYPYKKILQKYPCLRLYDFKLCMKEWTEYNFNYDIIYNFGSFKFFKQTNYYPKFLPDLHLVTDGVILLFEVEDYNPMSKEKIRKIISWCGECDSDFEPEIIIYGFDRYGNFQRIIYNGVSTEEECLEWLLELENTPDYNNGLLDCLKQKECRDRNFDDYFKSKLNESDLNEFNKKINELEKTTEGSIYY
tara:strand:+ start:42 stop:677 length:636 start_codon:yes stop_codon:yes gene_type:complete